MLPSKPEGGLAMYRSALVQNRHLAQLAKVNIGTQGVQRFLSLHITCCEHGRLKILVSLYSLLKADTNLTF